MNIRSIATAALAATLTVGATSAALTPSAFAADVSAPAVEAAPAAATTGSVEVDLTIGSVDISGSKPVSVACSVKGKTYTVATTKATIDGYQVFASAIIRNYTGPGTYTATISMGAKGTNLAAAGAVKGIKVTVTETGGVLSFAKTASGASAPKLQGATIAGSLTYTCNH